MRITAKNIKDNLHVDQDTAARVYGLMRMTVEPDMDMVDDRYKPFHSYDDIEYRLFEIDMLIGTHGVEYIGHLDDSMYEVKGISYCNTGDAYACTVMFDHKKHKFMLTSWGDIVERSSKYL